MWSLLLECWVEFSKAQELYGFLVAMMLLRFLKNYVVLAVCPEKAIKSISESWAPLEPLWGQVVVVFGEI